MKCNEVECKVVHLGRNDLVLQDTQWAERLGSISPGEGLEYLWITSCSEASNATSKLEGAFSKQRRPTAPRAALGRMCLAVLSAILFS